MATWTWYKIYFNADQSGATLNSPSVLYFQTGSTSWSGHWYTQKNNSSSNLIFSVTPPTCECLKFDYFAIDRNSSKKVTSGNGSSQLVDYYGWDGGTSVPFSNGSTAYAAWKRVSWKVTLSTGSGVTNNGTKKIYSAYQAGGLYSDDQCTNAISSIIPPTRSGYKFAGYNTAADGSGGAVVYANGEINDAYARQVLSHDVTVYAQWTPIYDITLDNNGGTGGNGHIYFMSGGDAFYSDATATTAIASVALPTMQHGLFLGYFTAQTGGDQKISAEGAIADDWTPNASTVLYAHWETVVTVTMDANGGIGGTAAMSYDFTAGEFCIVSGEPITAVDIPRKNCHGFVGYYTATEGGTQVIDAAGNILSALSSGLSDDITIYARWERVSYVAILTGDGGTTVGAIYCDGENAEYYEDDQLTVPLTSVAMPQRPGYSATGFYTASTGGSQMVSASGEILCGVISADVEYFAQWTIKTYWLAFDAMGGTVSPQGKSVTWQTEIGTLPTPSSPPNRAGAVFEGWFLNGAKISSSTVWDVDADAAAVARWRTHFANVTDYFGLASSALVPIASTNGDEYKRVVVQHGGKYESGVSDTGGIWRNPSVTYGVKANTTVAVKLGKAYAATFTGAGANRVMTISGYMITSVEIVTEVGKFPTVTVSAVANEGANAINNFTVNANKFNVSVPVVARSKAQNLLGAISGGGYLQRATLVALCDPVVVDEKMMPCASDIVNGRYELSAETLAANGEAAPTMAQAAIVGNDGGFALLDVPRADQDASYVRYTVQARREMV